MQAKVTTTIGSIPISWDVVYRREDGKFYSRRWVDQHVMVRQVCNSPCHWEEVEKSEEKFNPNEVVEAECASNT